jgi:hypothetical protein
MNETLQRTSGIVFGALRTTVRIGQRVVGAGLGALGRAAGRVQAPKPDMDDVTLARKVETEIFRAAGAPKGSVDVNAVDGVVYLRGEVKRPEQIKRLEARTRAIPEVRDVENLLHLPKTPAPTRADTPRRQQRTGAAKAGTKAATRPRGSAGAKTSQAARRAAARKAAEPSPEQAASEGTGRAPAPLGSTDNGGEAQS